MICRENSQFLCSGLLRVLIAIPLPWYPRGSLWHRAVASELNVQSVKLVCAGILIIIYLLSVQLLSVNNFSCILVMLNTYKLVYC